MEKQTAIPQKLWSIKLSSFRKMASYSITRLSVQLLARTSVTPNAISWFGFALTLGAAWLIITEHLFAAGFAVLVAGFFDMLDGALARSTERVTKFGAILDSTLDRFSEAVLLLSLLPIYARQQSTLGIVAVGLALLGSYLVSYIRARAEGMGLECEVGIFTRPERVVVLTLGLFLSRINYGFLTIALGIIIVFSFVAAGQRLHHAWRVTKK